MAQISPHNTELEAGVDSPRWSLNWIVSPRLDLVCFIGAALLGYGMFFLHAGLAMNMVTVWFVWYMLLDSPHFFGTYSRTYLDKEEWRNRRKLLVGSIALLGVGPVIIVGCWMLFLAGVESYKLPFLILVGFVSTWAYWHVVRQHWGILALYKRKNEQEPSLADRRIDQWALYIGLCAPFVAFAVTNDGARAALGFSTELAVGEYSNPYVPGGWETTVVRITQVVAALAIVVFVARQVMHYMHGRTLNLAKILFLTAVVPLHMVVCYHPASTTLHLLGFSACVTIFHDVQYHAIVWYYQKNRMSKVGGVETPEMSNQRAPLVARMRQRFFPTPAEEANTRYGLASRIGTSFPLYIICAVGMGLTLGLLGCLLHVNPGCIPVIPSQEIELFGTLRLEELFYGVFLGVLMHHYFVDQFIWRPSKDKNIQEDLKLQKANG